MLATPAAVAVGASPSFDCAKAASWVEHAVCARASLGDLDRQVADLYAAKRQAAGTAGETAIRDAQRAWARGGADCEKQGDAVACLEGRYRQRLAELGGMDAPAWAELIPPSLAAIDACLAATPATAAAVAGLQRDGDRILVALRASSGRAFACRAPQDGQGMVALHDAEPPAAATSFLRGAKTPCPAATPFAGGDGQPIGWLQPASC